MPRYGIEVEVEGSMDDETIDKFYEEIDDVYFFYDEGGKTAVLLFDRESSDYRHAAHSATQDVHRVGWKRLSITPFDLEED